MRRRAQLNASRHALTIALAALALSACGGSSLPVSSANNANVGVQPPSGKRTFHYIDRRQSFKVPVGVTQITVVALGAAGGGTAFGHGGRTYAVIPVTPGERLAVFVGGTPTGAKGGFNGGGPAGSGAYGSSTGYGGGGASDLRQGGEQLSNRVLIAAGGGGQGGFNEDKTGAGGKGGGSVGGTGGVGYGQYYSVKCYYGGRLRSDSYFGYYGGCGGTGGTQTQGGSGGGGGLGPFCYGTPGNAGSLGKGGAGGAGGSYECGGVGGGGGGGYYGGGGGGEGSDYGSSPIGGGGGGGGGSSYVEPNAIKSRTWAGWKSATTNGLVVLSWR